MSACQRFLNFQISRYGADTLFADLIARRTVAHELLGHCYLACRRAPFTHPLSLKGYGIVGSNGRPFEGTVIEFIERHVTASLGLRRTR